MRDGDDAHVRDLLRALAQYVDVDSLFALRDARLVTASSVSK
ncbi:hypothetical protein OG339_46525 [Streptosporangium sp. NBC_01495]|nr:hypothetical protein [Streptosporangium sp. NBC_01495]